MLAYTYPLLSIFWTMLEFFFFVLWIWLLIYIFIDIFRSHDMGGFAKALWVMFVIILPFLGVLVYLIARGGSMHERAEKQAQQQQQQFDEYVKKTAGSQQQRGRVGQAGRPEGQGCPHRCRVRGPEGQDPQLSRPQVTRSRQPARSRRRPLPVPGAPGAAVVPPVTWTGDDG